MFSVFGVGFGGIVIGALIVWALYRNFSAAKQGKPFPFPVKLDFAELRKAFSAARAGNPEALKIAFDKAIDIQLNEGDWFSWTLDMALDEVEARIKDPAKPAPFFDAVQHWSGYPRELLFELLKAELHSRKPVPAVPVATPVVAAMALALCLCFTGSASAAYPIPPQQFVATNTEPIIDPFVTPCHNSQCRPVEYVRYARGDACETCQPPGDYFYAENYGYQDSTVGLWQRGRRAVSAPFRFVARFRPLRRLFGGC